MRKFLLWLFAVCVGLVANGQVTDFGENWTSGNKKERGRLVSVEVTHNYVIVTIEVEALKKTKWLEIYSSRNTYIVSNGVNILKLTGQLSNDDRLYRADSGRGWKKVKKGERRRYRLYFEGHLPSTASTISIKDYGDLGEYGYCFSNYKIDVMRTGFLQYDTEAEIRKHIDGNGDKFCGIYASVGKGQGTTLACVKYGGEYYLIYVSSPSTYDDWKFWETGDVKARLQRTAVPGVMVADYWYNSDNFSTSSGRVTFDDGSMTYIRNDGKEEITYLRTYPYSTFL